MVLDVEAARKSANWFLEYLEEGDEESLRTAKLAMMMRGACNEIESLRARLAGAERDRDAGAWRDHLLRAEAAEAKLARYRETLEFYAQEEFYQMTQFCTAAPLQDLNGMPRNIIVDGNPIAHDAGKRAREILSGDGV